MGGARHHTEQQVYLMRKETFLGTGTFMISTSRGCDRGPVDLVPKGIFHSMNLNPALAAALRMNFNLLLCV